VRSTIAESGKPTGSSEVTDSLEAEVWETDGVVTVVEIIPPPSQAAAAISTTNPIVQRTRITVTT